MKRITSAILVICIMLSVGIFPAYGYEKLPAPDWVTVTPNSDYSKTVTIKTPTYMMEHIDYYEYSTDGFLTKTMLSKSGGEFVFDKTTEFSLRYVRYEIESEIYTVTVDINKITVITSDSLNISLLIPFGSSVHTDITLSAYEIVSGGAVDAVSSLLSSTAEFRLYNTAAMRGGRAYKLPEKVKWLFPCDGYEARFCKLYIVDSKGRLTEIESSPEMNMLLCETDMTGLFIVAQDKQYRPGDLNGDCDITALDARLALRISAKLEKASDRQLSAGDINKTSVIDAADARLILRASAKIDKL